jgi:AraC-like DNA-binding protein
VTQPNEDQRRVKAMPQLSLRSYGTEIACHAHNFNQIVLPRRGRLAMDVAGKGGAVSTRHGAFVAAGIDHAYQAGAGDEFFVLDLVDDTGAPDDIDADALERLPFFPLTAPQHDLLAYLDRMAVMQMTDGAAAARWRKLGESWGFLLLDSLAQAHLPSLSAGSLPVALRRALDLMRDRYGEKLSIAAIARAAGLSETRFFILFRQHLGMTPHAWLNDLRLTAAERLLAESSLPIAEIALCCGQSDQAALTRLMQRRHGTTPAAFRKRHRR